MCPATQIIMGRGIISEEVQLPERTALRSSFSDLPLAPGLLIGEDYLGAGHRGLPQSCLCANRSEWFRDRWHRYNVQNKNIFIDCPAKIPLAEITSGESKTAVGAAITSEDLSETFQWGDCWDNWDLHKGTQDRWYFGRTLSPIYVFIYRYLYTMYSSVYTSPL